MEGLHYAELSILGSWLWWFKTIRCVSGGTDLGLEFGGPDMALLLGLLTSGVLMVLKVGLVLPKVNN